MPARRIRVLRTPGKRSLPDRRPVKRGPITRKVRKHTHPGLS